MGMVARHLIMFAGEALQGNAAMSCHSAKHMRGAFAAE
jgi:hypothetical protein